MRTLFISLSFAVLTTNCFAGIAWQFVSTEVIDPENILQYNTIKLDESYAFMFVIADEREYVPFWCSTQSTPFVKEWKLRVNSIEARPSTVGEILVFEAIDADGFVWIFKIHPHKIINIQENGEEIVEMKYILQAEDKNGYALTDMYCGEVEIMEL